jgi:hypothetical protein
MMAYTGPKCGRLGERFGAGPERRTREHDHERTYIDTYRHHAAGRRDHRRADHGRHLRRHQLGVGRGEGLRELLLSGTSTATLDADLYSYVENSGQPANDGCQADAQLTPATTQGS